MDVSTSIKTDLNQTKVSNEKLQESLSSKVDKQEVITKSTADTVTLSQESIDASNEDVESLAAHAGGVYVPPKP